MKTQPLPALTMLLSRHTRRRKFIALFGGAAAAWPLAARAQQPTMPVVGWLGGGTAASQRAWVDAFVRRLGELGWIEGRTVFYSILEAKAKLEAEEANINALLGSMEGAEYVGPRAPKLPPIVRSMDARGFTLAALKSLGAEVSPQEDGLYLVEQNGGREWIRFDETAGGERRASLYAPGSAAFSRLVSQMIASGAHQVQDVDNDAARQADEITRGWVGSFGATPVASKVEGVRRCFEGKALVRVRATVAHDSYERLVEVTCASGEHKAHVVRSGLYKLPDVIENAHHLGINTERLADAAGRDPGIAEFCRFYMERRAQEMAAAGDDARKRKKLEDDFTPRLELTVVALEGMVHREVTSEAQYRFDEAPTYTTKAICG